MSPHPDGPGTDVDRTVVPESTEPAGTESGRVERRTVVVDGLSTSYLEAGAGDPVVLLHGGEFGANAELAWENTIGALSGSYRVLAPDLLGFGQSAKVVDFVDGRGTRIRHLARFCATLGVDRAHFVGNSMGAIMLLVDATSEVPVLPVRSLVAICGGGEIQRNEHMQALYDYDASMPAMRRIVEALFDDPGYPADDDYVRRRYESSTAPGAWEAVAAARFRRPAGSAGPLPSNNLAYQRISSPALIVEGGRDKLLPRGWAAEIAGRIRSAGSAVIDRAGHCPQIERADEVNSLLLEFLAGQAVRDESNWSGVDPTRAPQRRG